MIYWIAQTVGIVAFFISLVAYHKKTKKKILGNMVISNILNLVHYFLLGAHSGYTTKIIAIIRDLFLILKEKHKTLNKIIFLLLIIMIYITSVFITYNGFISTFPLISAIIYTIFIWNSNEIKIKKIVFICYIFWLIYNISILSIAGIISNTISIFSVCIAITRFKKIKNID